MELDHCKPLANALREARKIKDDITKLAVVRAKRQDLDKDPRLKDPNDHFFNKFEEFAMFKCAFYQCHKCKKPYFGGLMDCGAQDDRVVNREDLICGACAAEMTGAGFKSC